jgi:hypothetical protein
VGAGIWRREDACAYALKVGARHPVLNGCAHVLLREKGHVHLVGIPHVVLRRRPRPHRHTGTQAHKRTQAT